MQLIFVWKWTLYNHTLSVSNTVTVKTHIFCMQKIPRCHIFRVRKASRVIFYNLTIASSPPLPPAPHPHLTRLNTSSILQFNTSCLDPQWNPEETELWPKPNLQTLKGSKAEWHGGGGGGAGGQMKDSKKKKGTPSDMVSNSTTITLFIISQLSTWRNKMYSLSNHSCKMQALWGW